MREEIAKYLFFGLMERRITKVFCFYLLMLQSDANLTRRRAAEAARRRVRIASDSNISQEQKQILVILLSINAKYTYFAIS